MLKLKIALRNARKHGVLTFAKIFGLTLSVAVMLFAVAYVFYETRFDKNIPDYYRIYRCLMDGKMNGEVADYSVTSWAQAEGMRSELPEVAETVRIWGRGMSQLTNEEQNSALGELVAADTNFFAFFDIPVITNIDAPLATRYSIAVAKSMAKILFESAEQALGKTVTLFGERYTINAVFDDLPANSHLRIRIIQCLQHYPETSKNWDSQSLYTYFKTSQPITNPDDFNFRLSKLVLSHSDIDRDVKNAKNLADLKFSDDIYLYYTHEPLSAIHFSNHKFDMALTSNKTYVYGAVVLAILVFLISTFNYINLSIASGSTRLKELGIRKTIGARRSDITHQFLLETLLFIALSYALAVIVYCIAGKVFFQFLGLDVTLTSQQIMLIAVFLFGTVATINLLLTLIPIRMSVEGKLTSNGQAGQAGGTSVVRKGGLILVQFVLSGLIVLCTVVVQKQLNYFANMDRGYDPNNILISNMWEADSLQRVMFMEKMKNYPVVQAIASADVYFGAELSMSGAYFEAQDEANFFHPSVLRCSGDFPEVFGLKLKEGRLFDKQLRSDDNAVLLNEAAAREYSGEGSLLDKKVLLNSQVFKVIGIVNDFNFRTLHHPIEPLVICQSHSMGNVYIKIANSQVADFSEVMKKEWEASNFNFTFNLRINDEIVAERYVKEQGAKKILLVLSIISILIACVGLYAVSFFTIDRRTKEIGVRKVNGAHVMEVMTLLNKQFMVWVIISLVIASPLAWFVMNRWLENFAYRTPLSWWVFTGTGCVTLCIALLTVSYQSWKAATKNPVEALRYE